MITLKQNQQGYCCIRFCSNAALQVALLLLNLMGASCWFHVALQAKVQQILGADSFLAAMGTMDCILDTVSAKHPLLPLLELLKKHEKLILVGALTQAHEVPAFPLLGGRKLVGGSVIGGMKETQEMLDFAAKHNVKPKIKVVAIDM
ncbi:hypothetical protein Gotri_019003 [Gossypium trilobum]|uniref:Alcohol dehydrogenase-like C-terminal domain-containing protein n=1 Tax=Gossypium trilobum TaxID=34281 RepID=A0A7J9EBD6_9ROSI|nr:hypothetical protein [Gossypium trilobum]